MKFLKTLFGKSSKTPTWDITPEAERPAPRERSVFDEPTVSMEATVTMKPVATAQEEPNPFLDDVALDTIQLEADGLGEEDNPYQTHSWQMDPENNTRSLKTIPVGSATEKDRGSTANPYDTGSHRRGWKN